MTKIQLIQDLSLKDKIVLLRVDLNVPTINDDIQDDTRLVKILPTIRYLIDHQAKIIIISHFGRPKARITKEMSLKFISTALSKLLLGREVKFIPDITGDEVNKTILAMNNGDIIMLENLRFYAGEEKNDQEFVTNLANIADIYINDAFSCSHRAHASIIGLPKLLPAAAGLLLQDELFNIEKTLSNNINDFAAIIGGAKISTKLSLLNNLVRNSSLLVIGGAMANVFLKAKSYEIGKSFYESELIDEALNIIKIANNNNCKLLLPIDVVVARSFTDPNYRIVDIDQVDSNDMILDLGTKTIDIIIKELKDQNIKTLLWNGPVGVFEHKPFDIATINLAKNIARLTLDKKIISIAGGGDIVSALNIAGVADMFSYVSTAGGAFLEWLENKTLIGIEALKV